MLRPQFDVEGFKKFSFSVFFIYACPKFVEIVLDFNNFRKKCFLKIFYESAQTKLEVPKEFRKKSIFLYFFKKNDPDVNIRKSKTPGTKLRSICYIFFTKKDEKLRLLGEMRFPKGKKNFNWRYCSTKQYNWSQKLTLGSIHFSLIARKKFLIQSYIKFNLKNVEIIPF